MQSTIDMPVNDFKSIFSALIQSLDDLKVPKDYRISLLCFDGSIDLDVYPSDSSPIHFPYSFDQSCNDDDIMLEDISQNKENKNNA